MNRREAFKKLFLLSGAAIIGTAFKDSANSLAKHSISSRELHDKTEALMEIIKPGMTKIDTLLEQFDLNHEKWLLEQRIKSAQLTTEMETKGEKEETKEYIV